MENFDFSECAFIHENMRFFTYYDFCDNALYIKYLFSTLSKNAKLFYKWYTYANIHMNETFKNAIWDYLSTDDPLCYAHLLELKKQYRAK